MTIRTIRRNTVYGLSIHKALLRFTRHNAGIVSFEIYRPPRFVSDEGAPNLPEVLR